MQLTLFDHIFVDNFAGGGGASTGIELATGHPVDIAINHSESAILMHRKNHPFTEHYKEDVWAINPNEVTRGRPVKLAWFSPDCKHFSRAKGAALVDKKIRGLAWIVLRWAGLVRPDIIMLENVPEFVTWCPVRKGKPVKKKKGQTYRKWLGQLSDLGYTIESRVLCAADYGAPTIRKRFCLIARCDGKPITWPERTHAPRESEEVKNGKLKPWKAAAEIIDWTQPCYSIFESKEEIKRKFGARVNRPLSPNTLRRIARGLDKFVIKSAEPFIVPINHGERKGQAPRVNDIYNPLNTVVSKGIHALVAPTLTQYHTEQRGESVRGQGLREPIMTVDGSNRYGLAAMHLTQYFSGEGHYHSVDEPLATITTMEREGVIAAHLSKFYRGVIGADVKEPLPTVTAIDHNGLLVAHLAHFMGKDKGQSLNQPLMTITAKENFAQITTELVKVDDAQNLGYWNHVRDMLNEYSGYNIAADEILLLNIKGLWYFISDIGFRMLTPRELYNAMGFPPDYVIDKDIYGNEIKRADQVARCGNAVCPPMAAAMVRANLPDECAAAQFTSMSDLHKAMTA